MLKYGAGPNFDTSTHERLHQEVVGAVMAMDCRREKDRLRRMLSLVNERTCLEIVRVLLLEEDQAVAEQPSACRQLIRGLSFEGSAATGVKLLSVFLLEETQSWRNSFRAALTSFKDGTMTLLERMTSSLYSYPILRHEFGSDTLTYVASRNYLGNGPRYDYSASGCHHHIPCFLFSLAPMGTDSTMSAFLLPKSKFGQLN